MEKYLKLFPGKGWSKNKLTCKNAVSQILYGSCTLRVMSSCIKSLQEIIKGREWIPHIGPLTKAIRLKLFLDIVPSSSAEITRALRGCFREGFVYMYVVSFHFKAKENLQRCLDVFDILITTKGTVDSRYVLIQFETLIGV